MTPGTTEQDPRLGGSLQLFCAAAKNKRIAALQAHDGFPAFAASTSS